MPNWSRSEQNCVPDWNKAQFSGDYSTADRASHFLSTLYSQTTVPVTVTNCDKCFEASPLSSARLLLNRHDLHHFILEWAGSDLRKKEVIDDLNIRHSMNT